MASHLRDMTGSRASGDRRRWVVALVLWVCVIWGRSLMPGDSSSEESLAFLNIIRPLFEALGMQDADLMHLIVRKAGHFSEYLVLGMLASTAFGLGTGARNALLATCVIWVAIPCVDETIQLFVPDRVGAVTDVLIDMAGFATGLALRMAYRALRGRGRR